MTAFAIGDDHIHNNGGGFYSENRFFGRWRRLLGQALQNWAGQHQQDDGESRHAVFIRSGERALKTAPTKLEPPILQLYFVMAIRFIAAPLIGPADPSCSEDKRAIEKARKRSASKMEGIKQKNRREKAPAGFGENLKDRYQ